MQPVTAVRTTGIYCRPGCGARPSAGNVVTYPVAAAAEAAGYRACLSCRPYRSPMSAPWTGSDLVCRAVQLILVGALDEGYEADLARRLGVSERHLRRLFTAHLGVTPGGLARSARAHFARRLLDDTDMTVTEIAYATGFGSLRQFNRVCQEVFHASPRALRARRRVGDRLDADGGLALRLPYDGPLDWDGMVAYFAATSIPGVEYVAGRTYRRTVVIDGDPGVLELRPGGEDHVILLAHLPHWEQLIHIAEHARRVVNLDLDPREPVTRLAGDPLLGPLVSAGPGRRPPGTWDAFEAGVRALVGARVGCLVRRFGQPVDGLRPLGLDHTFPAPQHLAEADLRDCGIPPRRAAAVRAFARAALDDTIRLDRSVGLEQFVPSLTAIDGIGPQTAHYIALRLGEPDAWPITDRSLHRMLPDHARTATANAGNLAERWRPWRALAATHLWSAILSRSPRGSRPASWFGPPPQSIPHT